VIVVAWVGLQGIGHILAKLKKITIEFFFVVLVGLRAENQTREFGHT